MGLIIILTISLPDLFGWIKATSNPCVSAAVLLAFGAVEPGVVFVRPNRIGAATVSNPAATNNSFLLRSSLSATGSLMIPNDPALEIGTGDSGDTSQRRSHAEFAGLQNALGVGLRW